MQCQLTFNLKGKASVSLAMYERDLKNSSGPIALSLGKHLFCPILRVMQCVQVRLRGFFKDFRLLSPVLPPQ